ncbi:iron-siderophore ABC transporter substrate-binding protein [Saccharomonospora saliphila]|uniref:iron-siderophore ABC transporter substrate-binding protein n=1 Tax=Saccharomonospora saliphila TaxID=369829 RepID=UPI000375F3DD|nr:iron-siderophore ABC transporter substrate-binding protein [Saccharomonospora saliphila]
MSAASPRSRGLAVALSAVLVLAGCSGGAEPAAPSPEPAITPERGALPATIEHRYGSTTVPEVPRRVVTVGFTDQDALLALGVVPVATTRWLGDYPGAVGPWARDALGDADPPEVLRDDNGIRFERIAALEPDLILGLYSAMTREDYDTLSAIAPTIAPPEGHPDFGIPWQDLTTTVGRAVGRPAEARRLVAEVEGRFAEVRERHPEFAGAGAVVATLHEGYFVYGPDDPRTRVLAGLGFSPPPGLDTVVGDEFGASVSRERAELLDTDAVVWLTTDGGDTLRKDPLYNRMRVAREHREVLVDENSDVGRAFSHVSVLSLPYLLDRLTPRLDAAVDGDPATTG